MTDHKPADDQQQEQEFWAPPESGTMDAAELDYQPGIFEVADLPSFSPAPGIVMQLMTGTNVMVNWVRIEPNGAVPMHAHPHEQLGLVLEGAITMTIADVTRTLVPGHSYAIPGDLPHAAVAGPAGCLVLDVFSPVREEYVAAAMAR